MNRRTVLRSAKRGFTLVELVVVIAIIAVLAAILVPTLMGMATRSQVTSANHTADNLGETVERYLTILDGQGCGMRAAETATSIITITVESSGDGVTWTTAITNADTSFISLPNFDWTQAGTAITMRDAAIDHSTNAANLISIRMRDSFPDIKHGYIWMAVKRGHPMAVYFTDQTAAVTQLETSFDDNGNLVSTDQVNWTTKLCKWDDKNTGISSDGLVVGTYPALELGTP